MIGKTFAHYEITSQLGKGGMGEVYRAKDKVLGRDVAIKVLPEEFAKDADRVARFQREAKFLASLNHPNIAAIHGLEEANGTHFLVLELIEGDTLADRIKGGPIPVEESLKLALQIAEALEAAHERGVIHRDLKPANIKVTPDGKVKALDFGLAKAFAGEQAEMNLSNSPTLSDMATQQGVILGTAAYMSPEQARGKPVDKRTDIWAFGCVLYEMLTGKAAFQGEDVTEILAAVVKSGVNLDLLPEDIHSRVREVIIRCLQKDQKKRYADISEAQYEMDQAFTDPSGVFAQPGAITKPRKKLRFGIPWLAAALVLGGIIVGVAVWYLKPSEPRPVMRFDYELPEGRQFTATDTQLPTVSPDGSRFVYSTRSGLYLRALDQPTAWLIPSTDESSREPIFSPDGKSICYFSLKDGQLKRIAVSGGASETLCSAQDPRRPTWGVDDSIVYGQPQGLMQIPSKGGKPKVLINGSNIGEAQMLPGGNSVLYTISSGEGKKVAVQSLESEERKESFSGDCARYLPTGHIIYSFGNTLFAIQFDPGKLEPTGQPVPMVEDVLHGRNHSQYAVSDSGMLIYVPGTMDAAGTGNTLVWVDRKGNETPIAAPPDAYFFPNISPDGRRVALTVQFPSSSSYISIWDLVDNKMDRLTFDEAADGFPLWSPDGKRIAFSSRREKKGFVYWKAADNTGTEELLASGAGLNIGPRSWASNGKSLIFMEDNSGANADIGEIMMEGDRVKKPLLNENSNELDPQISPDGRWMAYCSNKSGQYEIYVCPYPEGVKGGKWKVSTGGGAWPLWSPDGKELFYRNGDDYMVVSVKTDPIFSKERPRILFHGAYAFFPNATVISNWDISRPDGKRFLMIKPPGAPKSATEETVAPAPQPKIIVVTNWFEELKKRVPTK